MFYSLAWNEKCWLNWDTVQLAIFVREIGSNFDVLRKYRA